MSAVKIIAMYFPQFHRIPQNDDWWGAGFTDWDKVKPAVPLYQGHRQPRVPLGDNYYSLDNVDVLKWQVDLAKQYGLYGFSIYHYWFDGVQMLQKPQELFLMNKDIDFRFSLTWANETWSRRWEGEDRKILQLQTHEASEQKWKEHFEYLLPFFEDKRAIRVDGKVLFQIYRPHLIPHVNNMLSYWRELAHKHGVGDLYFNAVVSFPNISKDKLEPFDGLLLFQPHLATNTVKVKGVGAVLENIMRALPEGVVELLRTMRKKTLKGHTVYDYENVCNVAVSQGKLYPGRDLYNMAFMEWDNTARYGKFSTIYEGCSGNRFKTVLETLAKEAEIRNPKKPLVFINAWNEWAEGTYLEPDTDNQYLYLEIIRQVISQQNE